MSNEIKDIDIKNRTYYFFNYNINIKNLDERSYKKIIIYYIGYVTMKDSMEINGNKCLTLVPTNKSKEKNQKIYRTVD